MAPIRRARHYVTYLMALFISGLFSLVGRHAPAWAQDVRSQQSAKIFSEVLQGNQASVQKKPTGTSTAAQTEQLGDSRALKIIPEPGNINEREGRSATLNPELTPEANQQVNETMNRIELKLRNKEALTSEEFSLLAGVQNTARLNDIYMQLNTLMLMVRDLQEKAPKQ